MTHSDSTGRVPGFKPDGVTPGAKIHSLSVSKVVDATEDAPRTRKPKAASRPERLKTILTTDLFHWFQTIKDRRFYQKNYDLEFEHIDRYFRDRGFQYSRGMSLMPSRRVLARFQALSGILHPREKIHVVAPGDPIFQVGSDSHPPYAPDPKTGGGKTGGGKTGGSKSGTYRAVGKSPGTGGKSPSSSGYTPDSPSSIGQVRAPRLLITSQRLLVFQGDHWVSHFYSDMVDELPSILSWCETAGWHRALDNENAAYYRRVRYVSSHRKRISVPCVDPNAAMLVSYIIQTACERNESLRRRRLTMPFPSARSYLEGDWRAEHLEVINRLADPRTSELPHHAHQRKPRTKVQLAKAAPRSHAHPLE